MDKCLVLRRVDGTEVVSATILIVILILSVTAAVVEVLLTFESVLNWPPGWWLRERGVAAIPPVAALHAAAMGVD